MRARVVRGASAGSADVVGSIELDFALRESVEFHGFSNGEEPPSCRRVPSRKVVEMTMRPLTWLFLSVVGVGATACGDGTQASSTGGGAGTTGSGGAAGNAGAAGSAGTVGGASGGTAAGGTGAGGGSGGSGGAQCVSDGKGVTTLATCKRACDQDIDCCKGAPGCPSSEYPYNVKCDVSIGACRSGGCCTSKDCLVGDDCALLNGLATCVHHCSPQDSDCTSPAKCVGLDDEGNSYCTPGNCEVFGCANEGGSCDVAHHVCVCMSDAECGDSKLCHN